MDLKYRLREAVAGRSMRPLILISRHASQGLCVSARNSENISARRDSDKRQTLEGGEILYPQKVPQLVVSAFPRKKKTLVRGGNESWAS